MNAPTHCLACGSDDLNEVFASNGVWECAECEALHYSYMNDEWSVTTAQERAGYQRACDDVRTVFDD